MDQAVIARSNNRVDRGGLRACVSNPHTHILLHRLSAVNCRKRNFLVNCLDTLDKLHFIHIIKIRTSYQWFPALMIRHMYNARLGACVCAWCWSSLFGLAVWPLVFGWNSRAGVGEFLIDLLTKNVSCSALSSDECSLFGRSSTLVSADPMKCTKIKIEISNIAAHESWPMTATIRDTEKPGKQRKHSALVTYFLCVHPLDNVWWSRQRVSRLRPVLALMYACVFHGKSITAGRRRDAGTDQWNCVAFHAH